MNLQKYIGLSKESDIPISEMEDAGSRIFPVGDGSYYHVYRNAPEEADFLANSAAQGDPDAIDEILELNQKSK